MAEQKRTPQGEPDPCEAEPTTAYIEEAGKEPLNDEMLPDKGEPVPQREEGGDECDTVGEHGGVDPSGAKKVGDRLEEAKRNAAGTSATKG